MSRRGPHNPNITWTPHVKVAWGGVLGTSAEIWTNSLKFVFLAPATILTVDQVNTINPLVWAALKTWFGANGGTSSVNSFIGREAQCHWLKINNVSSEGLQVSQQTNVYEGTPFGGSDNNIVPFYQSYAITLRTALKRGRSHAGRIFPPLVQPALPGDDGMCSAADATIMANTWMTCFKAMQSAIVTNSGVGSFSVISPGNSEKSTLPIYQVITGAVVDRVPDVQHRRTNRLARAEGGTALVGS